MKKLLLLALFGAYSLLAADLTGHWSGSVQSKSPDGEDHNEDVLLILKQDGSTITGTAGPNEEEQTAIVKAVLEGDTLRFDVITDEGMAFHVTLKLDGNTLEGTAKAERPDGQTRTAVVKLKRA